MVVDIYSPTQQDTLSSQELKLYHKIMAYRATAGLPAIPLSSALTATEGRHALDTKVNIWAAGLDLPNSANLHSWSDAFYRVIGGVHQDPDVMWSAPERLGTGFTGNMYEISAAGQTNIGQALKAWQGSPGHNVVIMNLDDWAALDWQSIGIGVITANARNQEYQGNIFHVSFSDTADTPPLISGNAKGEVFKGTLWDDTISGRGGADRIKGRSGDDTLSGDKGKDTIHGNAGDDTLDGGGHRDQLVGGAGDDTLEGGGGADRFIFGKNAGNDQIVDFQDGIDRIQFVERGLHFRDLTITPDGANTLITYSGGTILLLDSDVGDITKADFLFA